MKYIYYYLLSSDGDDTDHAGDVAILLAQELAQGGHLDPRPAGEGRPRPQPRPRPRAAVLALRVLDVEVLVGVLQHRHWRQLGAGDTVYTINMLLSLPGPASTLAT